MKAFPVSCLIFAVSQLIASAAPASDSNQWCVVNFAALGKSTLGREVYQGFFTSEVAALIRQKLPERFCFLEQAQPRKIRIETLSEDVSVVILQVDIDRAAARAVLADLVDYVQFSYVGHVVHHFRCDPEASFESLLSDCPEANTNASGPDPQPASAATAATGGAEQNNPRKEDAIYLCELPENQWVLARDLAHLAATVDRVVTDKPLTNMPADLVVASRFPLQVPGTEIMAELTVKVARDGRITARLTGDCESDAARGAIRTVETLIYKSPQLEGMLTQWFRHLRQQQDHKELPSEGLDDVAHGRFSIGFARVNSSRLDEPVAEDDLNGAVEQLATEVRDLLQFRREDSTFEFSISAYVGAKSSRFAVVRGKCDMALEFSVFTSLEEMNALTAKAAADAVQR